MRGIEFEFDGNRVRDAAFDGRDLVRLERTETGSGEIAGDAAHAEAIRPVRRDGDVEHHVVQAERRGSGTADLGFGRKLDDAGMLVGELQLALREQHAARFDAADLRLGQGHVDAGHIGADRCEDALEAGACVGRAAHDLQPLAAGIDLADLELVRVRMLLARQHLRDAEVLERIGGIEHFLDLEPDAGQRVGDLSDARLGVEMLLEP